METAVISKCKTKWLNALGTLVEKFGGQEPGKVIIFQDGKGTTPTFISVVV